MIDPRAQACCHAPSPEEKERDRDYLGCAANPGEPCTWCKRFDGLTDPDYHSERWDAALFSAQASAPTPDAPHTKALRDNILSSGLV